MCMCVCVIEYAHIFICIYELREENKFHFSYVVWPVNLSKFCLSHINMQNINACKFSQKQNKSLETKPMIQLFLTFFLNIIILRDCLLFSSLVSRTQKSFISHHIQCLLNTGFYTVSNSEYNSNDSCY